MRSCKGRAGGNVDLTADRAALGVIEAVGRRENVATDHGRRRSASAWSAATRQCFQRAVASLHAPDTVPNWASCEMNLGALPAASTDPDSSSAPSSASGTNLDAEAFDLSSAELGGSLRLRGPVLDRIAVPMSCQLRILLAITSRAASVAIIISLAVFITSTLFWYERDAEIMSVISSTVFTLGAYTYVHWRRRADCPARSERSALPDSRRCL